MFVGDEGAVDLVVLCSKIIPTESEMSDELSLRGASLTNGDTYGGSSFVLGRRWSLAWKGGPIIASGIQLMPDGLIEGGVGVEYSYWSFIDGRLCLLNQDKICTVKFQQITKHEDGSYNLVGRFVLDAGSVRLLTIDEDCIPFKEILGKFESLGDNCEFGIVQRYFGIEHLGLFRFNGTPLSALMMGLDDHFIELEKPGAVRVEAHDCHDYIGFVPKYGFVFHTFRWIRDGGSIEKFVEEEQAKLIFLRRKFFEDLESGEKIFVRKGDNIDDIIPLYDKLRTFGNNSLLWVSVAEDDQPDGMVERVHDDLLRGYVRNPSGTTTQITADTWAKLCRNAHEIAFGS